MNLPSFVLGAAISVLMGSAFHLLVGGGLIRLLFDLALGATGFWAGHFLAELIGFNLGSLGSLHLAPALALALLFLFVGHWLSLGTRVQESE